ncbi:hypothetical protein NMY22_g17705 [Coprinellus aureogranulatus]|nr:hypothetical protein NMY22_g17705 [Coprinellus aureogranulatus]
MYSYGANGLPTKYDSKSYSYGYSPSSSFTDTNAIDAMAFLPYPPSPPARHNLTIDTGSPKPRKKRSSSRSRSNGELDDRIRSSDDAARASRRQKYLASQYSGFGMQDDGCLGGF